MARRGDEIYWHFLVDAIPAVILFAGSLIAFVMARKQRHGAGLVLIWTLLAAVVFFIHDATSNNWQVQMMIRNKGCEFSYYNWPWYQRAIGRSRIGLIDKRGNFVAESEFSRRHRFSEGLAATRIDDNYGYVNQAGDVIIQPQFSYANRFSEGLASVKVGDKYGYIDKAGQFVIQPQFDLAGSFSEGLARVVVKHKNAYPDRTDLLVNQPKSDSAGRRAGGFEPVELDDNCGVIDRRGRIVIEPKFSWIADFSEGMARAILDERHGFINNSGEFLALLHFDEVDDFHGGLARVRVGKKWGYVDRTGQIVISAKFDYAYRFSEGLAGVVESRGGKWGYVDKRGRFIIKPKFDCAWPFSEGLARVMKWYGGKFGYIDKTGQFVIKPKFDSAENFENGVARVRIAKAVSRSTSYGIVIGLAAGFFVVGKRGRRRKEMDADSPARQTTDQSDDWHLYNGLSLEHKGYQDWIAELTAGRISTAEFKKRTENQKEYLLELIDKLLAGRISFKDFAESYCPFVLNLVPDFMSQRDEESFEMVREKLEWVSRSPAARREDGIVITPEEFIEWLREEKAKHFEGGQQHDRRNPRS